MTTPVSPSPDGSTFPEQRTIETGDDLDETTFLDVFGDAAQRTEFLRGKVDVLEGGVSKLRAVASPSALKSLTDMNTGEIALISPASVGTSGLYMFKAGTPLGADVARWAYDANDGSGTWFRDVAMLMVLGGAGGNQPRLNTDSIRVPNSIVEILETTESSPNSRDVASASGAMEDSGFSLGTNPFTAGDKVKIIANVVAFCDDSNGMRLQLAVFNGSTTTKVAGTQTEFFTNSTTDHIPVCLAGLWTVPSSGNWDIKVQVGASAGAGIKLFKDRRIEAMVIRP